MRLYFAGLMVAMLNASCLAHAAPPSAPLTVNVVPHGGGGGGGGPFTCGPAPGTDAATDVAAAGFTTCALGNDFTQTIPNTAGTGLPSGWLNCTRATTTGAVWNAFGASVQGGTIPCPGAFAQATDTGVTPNTLALKLHYNSSYMVSGNPTNDNMDWLGTMDANNTADPNVHSFSTGYFQWTTRWQSASAFSGNTQGFYSFGQCCGTDYTFVDLEFTEQWPGQAPDWGWNYWNNATPTLGKEVHFNGLDKTTYNTVGVMLTANSGTGLSVCAYLNGSRVECDQGTYPTGTNGGQRRQLFLWNGVTCNYDPANISCAPTNFGDADLYIKSILVNTCSAETTGGTCYGTTLNGTGFYVP